MLEDVRPSQMNFVTAVWYAEWAALQIAYSEIPERDFQKREAWLRVPRHALPSCFCDQNNLPD